MPSSDGNIFRGTGHLCREYRWFPSQMPVTRSFDVFLDLSLNKGLSKQSWRRWFPTPSCSLRRHCNKNRPILIMVTQCKTHIKLWYHFLLLTLPCGKRIILGNQAQNCDHCWPCLGLCFPHGSGEIGSEIGSVTTFSIHKKDAINSDLLGCITYPWHNWDSVMVYVLPVRTKSGSKSFKATIWFKYDSWLIVFTVEVFQSRVQFHRTISSSRMISNSARIGSSPKGFQSNCGV